MGLGRSRRRAATRGNGLRGFSEESKRLFELVTSMPTEKLQALASHCYLEGVRERSASMIAKCIAAFSECICREPRNAMMVTSRAMAWREYATLLDETDAQSAVLQEEGDWSTAISLEPDKVSWRRQRAHAYFSRAERGWGSCAEQVRWARAALADYDTLIGTDPGDARNYVDRGTILFGIANLEGSAQARKIALERSLVDFDEAVRRNPNVEMDRAVPAAARLGLNFEPVEGKPLSEAHKGLGAELARVMDSPEAGPLQHAAATELCLAIAKGRLEKGLNIRLELQEASRLAMGSSDSSPAWRVIKSELLALIRRAGPEDTRSPSVVEFVAAQALSDGDALVN